MQGVKQKRSAPAFRLLEICQRNLIFCLYHRAPSLPYDASFPATMTSLRVLRSAGKLARSRCHQTLAPAALRCFSGMSNAGLSESQISIREGIQQGLSIPQGDLCGANAGDEQFAKVFRTSSGRTRTKSPSMLESFIKLWPMLASLVYACV